MLNGPWKCASQFVIIRSDNALVLRASVGRAELCACWKSGWLGDLQQVVDMEVTVILLPVGTLVLDS